ncbi:hypothetical protein CORC01_04403 [Colletotrichum orchidophilum]|uniref:Uncharacterized protein n=1 Tax=Colletotrichum orchidophilum TaxID=1209926 RepID=A0A1G4BFP7_9PEZI|nr:uncharacterized protein CORC01_04403 [Colletotrichum orchidophilum]OHF00214.1 hypothetical protein CORC01_04403 [Colletotrichum orchidophilum]
MSLCNPPAPSTPTEGSSTSAGEGQEPRRQYIKTS